jgi:hypothetical protein
MSWLSNLFSHIKHAAVVIGAAFAKLVGHDRAVEFGHAALDVLQSDLGKIAATAVDAVQTQDPTAPGDTKFATAVGMVKSAAQTAGIEAKDSLIHLLVQLAVSVIKGHFAPGV